jgi:hypothetical protein
MMHDGRHALDDHDVVVVVHGARPRLAQERVRVRDDERDLSREEH